jgi:integrase/recombinase XerD
MDIQTAINGCLADLSLAPNTQRSYRNGLKNFLHYLAQEHISPTDEITALSVDRFIGFMPWLDGRYSKQTAGVYLSGARALMNYLMIQGVLSLSYQDANRFQMATKRSHSRHEEKLPRFPAKDDADRMLAAARIYHEDSPRKERNIALVELLASSGCRISEVIALNVQDIDIVNRTAIVMGKGSKERQIFFSASAAEALKAYWRVRRAWQPTDPIFARHDRGAGHKRVKRMTTTTARTIVRILPPSPG